MTVIPYFIALMLFGQVADSANRYATADGNPVIQPARIYVRDEAKIPAMEAGVLTEFSAHEGARVKKGEVLAVIDDREAKARLKIAKYAELAAWKLVKQDIEERYAAAAANVAKSKWESALDSNKQYKGAVVEGEMMTLKLDFKRATLQIEKAANDRVMASYDAKTKTAEKEAAEMALDWRTIRAPFDGDVVKTFVHQSEWVQPGEAILQLVRFDKLYVEGHLLAKDYDRSEILGKPVTVEVTKARGRKATVSGTIVHVDQILQGRGRYNVRAEVDNELVNGSWLLQPGGEVRMTIHLK
ncbi:MAG: HlyD family efflux transporter periplasmic adaptor subunit [Planctomycetes bacterium]|nr:HlyD family efflux transporter periplasmic adaptor subunit [Planctomycetota bacterium]